MKRVLAIVAIALTLTSCTWRGIANVPLPIGRGTGSGHMTIYVQVPDTLAWNNRVHGVRPNSLGRHLWNVDEWWVDDP